MIKINIYYNPLIDSIDTELTEKRMAFIEDNFTYTLCNLHPNEENELAYKAADGKDFVAPIKFCCSAYQNKVMMELNDLLYQNPIRPESS